MLLENSGQIVDVAGGTKSPLCIEAGNYFTFLREEQDGKVIDRLYSRVQNKKFRYYLSEDAKGCKGSGLRTGGHREPYAAGRN